MSKANAMTFMEKASQDSALQQKLQGLGSGASVENILDVAAAEGYNFSAEDFVAASKEWTEKHGSPAWGELSESELEQVAGGIIATVDPTVAVDAYRTRTLTTATR